MWRLGLNYKVDVYVIELNTIMFSYKLSGFDRADYYNANSVTCPCNWTMFYDSSLYL